ncbi:hypothetical protein [Butyrivibrio proteoclasticus]|uniref:hypothetical protein n=1 Tax=Butyrivibrio proteoclasticus TaxID=43305 RepID=UPI000479CC62|nr:hypothetical protein [Butyrivibrio proteoclasticus]
MGRTFRYIQNDDVLKSFMEYKDSLLSERPVVIARHGDYSLVMRCLSGDTLGLTIENDVKKTIVESRTYDTHSTTEDLVSRGVRHACQKMSEISDREVNRKRMQIWKWYVMEWQLQHPNGAKEFMDKELTWKDDGPDAESDLMDIEAFLHGDYLNLGNTLALIDKYLSDVENKELFKKFAIADIMEMTRDDTRDRSLEEAEKSAANGEIKKHYYQFLVSVEATDKEHAREALLSYLAGDERIRVQR